MGKFLALLIGISILASTLPGYSVTVRVSDVALPMGVPYNQLVGIGLVTGLTNIGDKDPVYILQRVAYSFQTFGFNLPAQLSSKNVAVVWVTAKIPQAPKEGDLYDVTIAAMGDAKSLQGGVLARTALHGVDKKAYAMAQGPLSVSKPSSGDSSGANAQTNRPATATIANGATLLIKMPATLVPDNTISLILRRQDSKTATRIAEAINADYPNSSRAESADTVKVKIPQNHQSSPLDFLAQILDIEIQIDATARVIINERTGAVVATPISNGHVTVKSSENSSIPQPFPNSNKETITTTNAIPNANEIIEQSKDSKR